MKLEMIKFIAVIEVNFESARPFIAVRNFFVCSIYCNNDEVIEFEYYSI